jgi:protein SCO1/2
MKLLAKSRNVVLAAVAVLLAVTSALAQGGSQHYNSPLYSPRTYDPANQAVQSSGLPEALKTVGIEQRLNEQLPLDTKFKDENGREVALGEYFGKGKPVVLALVYYECPMLCNQVLTGLTGSLKGINFTAGKEFEVVAVSFDPRDTPEIAKAKKETYLANYGRPDTANAWHFLTGTPDSIKRITESVGFRYEWDEATKQFAHAGGIQIATPDGKLARYFYGIDYAPKDVKFGLMEASSNKIGNPVEQLVLYCYHYNPASGKYGLAIMNVVRLGGVATIIGLAAMLLFLSRYNSNKKDETANAA